jgi:16S rRNA A1518/A1519 N6-dimethyltransferase RsmA/KsgA/DIM1 with predicted DNA glycosylase/AP lyase activity
MARRGYVITAVELGSDLAAVVRHELQRYPNVRIITGTFENVDLPEHAFDLM